MKGKKQGGSDSYGDSSKNICGDGDAPQYNTFLAYPQPDLLPQDADHVGFEAGDAAAWPIPRQGRLVPVQPVRSVRCRRAPRYLDDFVR